MGMEGEAWRCPHCGEVILRSAGSCPACQRRLRFDVAAPSRPPQSGDCPLSVEGVIRHPGSEAPWEYSLLVQVFDARGETLTKRVVGVGVMLPGETRRFTLRVEMQAAEQSTPAAASSRRPAGE